MSLSKAVSLAKAQHGQQATNASATWLEGILTAAGIGINSGAIRAGLEEKPLDELEIGDMVYVEGGDNVHALVTNATEEKVTLTHPNASGIVVASKRTLDELREAGAKVYALE